VPTSLGQGKVTHRHVRPAGVLSQKWCLLGLLPISRNSPHGAAIVFMVLKEKIAKGRGDVKHMKTLRKKGKTYLPRRAEGKERRLEDSSTFMHYLR
jgi:hypothetical protein